jgi:hypothetical protein
LTQITKLTRNFSKPTTPSLLLGKKARSTNLTLPLMRSQIQNYQRTTTGEISKEWTSLTHIETKDTVDLATLCLLLRSLRWDSSSNTVKACQNSRHST